jgi:hypothetical protein
MARYVLECPKCESRFELTRYEPDRRVHCRTCRAVVIIPAIEEPAPPPVLRHKLGRVFPLGKLLLVSTLLAVALAGGFAILVRKGNAPARGPEKKTPEKITLETLPMLNHALAFPLGRGFSWEYEIAGGGRETRRVIELGTSAETGEPEGDIVQPGLRQSFRVTNEGVFLVSEIRPDGRYVFSKPVSWVPYPLYSDSSWEYEGEAIRAGVPPEKWKLSFEVQGLEAIDWGSGEKACFRLHVKGEKGTRKIEEILWYSIGTGLVKRMARIDGRVEEAKLTRFTR